MSPPEDPPPHVPLSLSMLISESVYKIIVLIERTLLWLARFVLRPCLLQFRCLFW